MMFGRRGTRQNGESVLCLQTSLGIIQSLQYLLIGVVKLLDSGTSGNSNTGSSLATCLPCTRYQRNAVSHLASQVDSLRPPYWSCSDIEAMKPRDGLRYLIPAT